MATESSCRQVARRVCLDAAIASNEARDNSGFDPAAQTLARRNLRRKNNRCLT